MADINVTEETINIDVTENIIIVESPTGGYPILSTVYSVFGRTGAIVATLGDYTSTLITEGTNLYFTNARSRAAISLTTTGTSGAATYDSGTGVLNIPQYSGGGGGITLASLSSTSPLLYNNTTGVFSIQIATTSQNGYLSSTDFTTFNNKQEALGFTPYNSTNPSAYISLTNLSSSATGLTYTNTTGVFSLTSGYSIPTNSSQTNWDSAYTNRITSLTTTGSSGANKIESIFFYVAFYVKAFIGLFLMYRFNSWREKKIRFTDLDRKACFSAGFFIILLSFYEFFNRYLIELRNIVQPIVKPILQPLVEQLLKTLGLGAPSAPSTPASTTPPTTTTTTTTTPPSSPNLLLFNKTDYQDPKGPNNIS
jgi:hypothetical protein